MYAAQLGRFIGRDHLGYVDGESLYPAYFAPHSVDPMGMQKKIIVRPSSPRNLKGNCRNKLYASWYFLLPRNHKKKGYVVQKVVVSCAVDNCVLFPKLKLETTCGTEIHPEICKCQVPDPVTFTYYEAWRVGFNQRRVINPDGVPATEYDDTAGFEKMWDTCGKYVQLGELRFYSDSDTEDLTTKWPTRQTFGIDTPCPTTPKELYSFDGKDGPPGFWKDKVPIAEGSRKFRAEWRCCGCDPRSKRKAKAWSDP